ncbi:MAG: glycosyltransferase family A protein [Monoglobales bacterium]
MSKFQVLCVTMNQKDFSKVNQMNLHSDVIFANQTNETAYKEYSFEGHTAKMLSTNTRGVGINRNISLMLAESEICLFADDDMVYEDDLEEQVVSEFVAHPDADVIIFNVKTVDDTIRKQKQYTKTRKCSRLERMPWGGVRIAFRLSSVKKANIWFTTLFGGGAVYASGEDSIWLKEAKRKGLCFYVSSKTIGTVYFDNSTWYTGRDEKLFYARGAYISQIHKSFFGIWSIYYGIRFSKNAKISFIQRIQWIYNGKKGYDQLISYEQFKQERNKLK